MKIIFLVTFIGASLLNITMVQAALPAFSVNTLGQLSCATDEVAKFDGVNWICAEDVDTSAATECPDDEVLLGDGSCADASANKLSCAFGEVAKYDDVLNQWACGEDIDTDTNATTECSDSEVLFADGSCVDASGLLILPTDRFVDNGDGTIADNKTRLMWEMKLVSDGSQGGNCDSADQGNRDVRCVNNDYNWTKDFLGVEPNGTLFTVFIKKRTRRSLLVGVVPQ